MNTLYQHWLEPLCDAATEAGALIMQYRERGFDTLRKGDNSPVTEADKAADNYICAVLQQLTPDIPIISEEGNNDEQAASAGRFWCVDPLDGTKGFIRGEDQFTVNIGLIEHFIPVLGIIYIPAQSVLYAGIVGHGAFRAGLTGERISIKARTAPAGDLAAVVSTHHGKVKESELRERYGVSSFVSASSSLKFCMIAEGKADIYPRFGNTMEWDTAAGQAILCAAGGRVDDATTGKPLSYAKKGFLNPNFIAWGQ